MHNFDVKWTFFYSLVLAIEMAFNRSSKGCKNDEHELKENSSRCRNDDNGLKENDREKKEDRCQFLTSQRNDGS